MPRMAGTIEPSIRARLRERLRTEIAGRTAVRAVTTGLVTIVCVRVSTRKRVAPSRLSIVNR